MRRAVGLCLLCAALARGAAADQAQGIAPPAGSEGAASLQPVTGADMNQLRGYGQKEGEALLAQKLGVNINDLAVVWDPATDRFVTARELAAQATSSTAKGGGAAAPVSRAASTLQDFQVRVAQTGAVGRLSQGLRNVPFGVQVNGSVNVLELPPIRTSLSMPLSPYDAWSAHATMALHLLAGHWWWRGLGLGDDVDLRSNVSSRLGFNEVEAGLGTVWTPGFWGRWNLDYDWNVHYGQGSGGSQNVLKVSKTF